MKEYIEREALVRAAKKYGITLPSIMMNAAPTYTSAEIVSGMWVPASEKLPEVGAVVLAVGKKGASIGEFRGIVMDTRPSYWWLKGNNGAFAVTPRTVTHWMPLPEPPKEAEQ